MERLPNLPRRRRSKRVRPTTPTFLSLPDAPPPTKPVVYSPVPTMQTLRGGMVRWDFLALSVGVLVVGEEVDCW